MRHTLHDMALRKRVWIMYSPKSISKFCPSPHDSSRRIQPVVSHRSLFVHFTSCQFTALATAIALTALNDLTKSTQQIPEDFESISANEVAYRMEKVASRGDHSVFDEVERGRQDISFRVLWRRSWFARIRALNRKNKFCISNTTVILGEITTAMAVRKENRRKIKQKKNTTEKKKSGYFPISLPAWIGVMRS